MVATNPQSFPPPLPAASTSREQAIRLWYIRYIEESHSVWEQSGPILLMKGAFAFASAATLAGIPLAIHFIFSMVRTSRRAKAKQREMLEFASRAVPIMVYPLMVNTMLTKYGTRSAPGLAIGSFEQGIDSSPQMHELAMKLFELLLVPPTTADERFLHELMADEKYQPNRRRKLPESLTGPLTVYAFDLAIDPRLLKGNHISEPQLPCMAEPGDVGQIHLMPWWVVESAVPLQ